MNKFSSQKQVSLIPCVCLIVCKSSSSSSFVRHWRQSTLRTSTSPTHRFHQCLSLLSIRCISTTATTNQQSLTVSYLIDTCGFSPESALSLSNKFQLKSPDKAGAVISFFKSHGFLQTHISDIIQKFPSMLLYDPQKTLLPKLEFLYSKGFSSHDLTNLVSKYPQVLSRSLENHMIPSFNYLCNLLESQERTIAFIKRRPSLLDQDLDYMAPKVNILLEHGVPKSNIFMHILRCSFLLVKDRNDFKEVVEEVKEMGINPLRSQFVRAVWIKTTMSRSQWESKMNMYKRRWGWSEDEFLKAFWKHPQCMEASEDKIMVAMDFFVNKMGLESSYIAKHPIFLSYSLHKRVIPRAAVFQFVSTKGLIKSKHASFVTLFDYSEKVFIERFVNSYDEAPLLLKLYKDKFDMSKT